VSKKKIEIVVSVKNLVMRGLASVKRSLMRFKAVADGVMKGVGIGARVAAVGVGVLGLAVRQAFKKEGYMAQLEFFTGSVSAAKTRWLELKGVISNSEFSVDQIFAVSKALQISGATMKENAKWVTLVGDAAARLDPTRIEEFAQQVARIRLGVSTGEMLEPLKQLELMGGFSAGAAKEINEVAKATGNVNTVMALVSKELEAFNGGMEASAKLGNGLFSTFISNAELALMSFGHEIQGFAKETLREANAAIIAFSNSDEFEEWAQRTAQALEAVKDLVGDLFSSDKSKRFAALSDLKLIFTSAMGAAVAILLSGAAAAGRIIGDTIFSGPNATDMAQARGIAASRGMGKEVTTFNASRAGVHGTSTHRQFSASEREEVKKIANQLQRKRLVAEQGFGEGKGASVTIADFLERRGGALAGPSAPEPEAGGTSAPKDLLSARGAFGTASSPMATIGKLMKIMNNPDAMARAVKMGAAPPTLASGKALSVGDLFDRASNGKPDGSKSKPLNVNVVAMEPKISAGVVEG